MEHFNGTKGGEVGHVQTIIFIYYVEQLLAFATRKFEKMHVVVVHAQQLRHEPGLLGRHKVSVCGCRFAIAASFEVEAVAIGVVAEVGTEAQQPQQSHQKR